MSAADITKNGNKVVSDKMDKVGRAIGMEILGRVTNRTPVDTGRAKGNWNTSINRPDFSTSDNVDKSGASTRSRGKSVMNGFRLGQGQTLHISNGLPYIERLEQGYSQQAPTGMVTVTIAELRDWVQRIGGRLSNG